MARTVHLPQHPLYRSPINQSQNLIQRPATLLHQAVCKTLLSSLLAHRSHLALTKLNHIPAKTTSQFCKALLFLLTTFLLESNHSSPCSVKEALSGCRLLSVEKGPVPVGKPWTGCR